MNALGSESAQGTEGPVENRVWFAEETLGWAYGNVEESTGARRRKGERIRTGNWREESGLPRR